MTDAPALQLEGVRVRLGQGRESFEFSAPDLAMPAGTMRSCVGPSGCGKSTLIRLCAGIITPITGTIRVHGTDLGALDDGARRARRIASMGLVFQDFALLAHLSGLENILLPLILAGRRVTPDDRARAHTLATEVEVDHTLRRRPSRISHGERQRIAVCRALIARPALLLCDEPSASLDERRSDLVLDLIDRHRTDHGVTVLITTHDVRTAERVGDVLDLARPQAVTA